jgi:hypothetical protein
MPNPNLPATFTDKNKSPQAATFDATRVGL